MTDPIERLLWEHQGIMRQVGELRGAVKALAERGDAALAAVRPVLQGTVRMIETELLAHARREDDALFPAIERALSDSQMTGQMQMAREVLEASELAQVSQRMDALDAG
jgi:iron-sulfur cluster repair protein YtfE (RIC family)